MHARKSHSTDKGQTPPEVALCLSGKSNNDVRGYGQIWNGCPRRIGQRCKFGGGIAPPHASQRVVAATLQREVEMAAQARIVPVRKGPLGQIPRLNRGQAQTGHIGLGENARYEAPEIGARLAPVNVTPVSTDMDASQHNLLVASRQPPFHRTQYLSWRAALLRSPRQADDTVGASVVAAILDLDEGTGA